MWLNSLLILQFFIAAKIKNFDFFSLVQFIALCFCWCFDLWWNLGCEWIFFGTVVSFSGVFFLLFLRNAQLLCYGQYLCVWGNKRLSAYAINDVGLMSKIDVIEWIFLSSRQRPETQKLSINFHHLTCEEATRNRFQIISVVAISQFFKPPEKKSHLYWNAKWFWVSLNATNFKFLLLEFWSSFSQSFRGTMNVLTMVMVMGEEEKSSSLLFMEVFEFGQF